MGLLTSPVCCALKCCGCIILSQLLALLFSVGAIVLFVLFFYFYLLPWGEDQIIEALGLPNGTDYDSIDPSVIAQHNCSGCVFGVNSDWPTQTNGTLHFLDTSAGSTISSVVATSLVATAAAGAGTMIWATIVPSMASALSLSSGFYEMTHIFEQAQYIGMIGQLQLHGAPEFLMQFSKEMAWTNFNLPKSMTDPFFPGGDDDEDEEDTSYSGVDTAGGGAGGAGGRRRRRLEVDLSSTSFQGESGPAKYANMLGVEPKDLFFYTLLVFVGVLVLIHVLYLVWVVIMTCLSKKKSFGQVAGKWYRKVVWACLLTLLLAQYIFAMAGSYYVYENMGSDEPRDSKFALGCVALVVMIAFAIFFGVAVIAKNTDELKDIGTFEHDQRPFAAKYSAYYDEYNYDNRYFFVPRIGLAVATGAVVGIVQDPTKQLFIILGVTVLYLIMLIIREPNLLRFLYYIGITSVFMKVVLLCLMLVLVQDDYFPQEFRDNAAYAIVGINLFIFALLFLRQAYVVIHKIIRGCKNKGKNVDSDGDDSDDDAAGRHHGYLKDKDTERGYGQGQQQPYQPLNSTSNGAANSNAFGSDPYAQAPYKHQPYSNQNGAAGAYGQEMGSQSGYGQQNGSQSGYGQQNGSQAGYGQQAGSQSGYGQQNGSQSGYGQQVGSQAGYDPQNANNGYGAANNGYGNNAGMDMAYGATGAAAVGAAARSSGDNKGTNEAVPVANAAEPEKFGWRRNMEQRAGPQNDIANMYLSGSDAQENALPGGAVGYATQQPQHQPMYTAGASSDSNDMFLQRAESGNTTDGSDRSYGGFVQATNASGHPDAPPIMEFRDSEEDVSRTDVANASFLTADSYSSRQHPLATQSSQLTNSSRGAPVTEFRDSDTLPAPAVTEFRDSEPDLDGRVDNASFMTADSELSSHRGLDDAGTSTRRPDGTTLSYLEGLDEKPIVVENDLGDDDEDDKVGSEGSSTDKKVTPGSGSIHEADDPSSVDIDAVLDDSDSDSESEAGAMGERNHSIDIDDVDIDADGDESDSRQTTQSIDIDSMSDNDSSFVKVGSFGGHEYDEEENDRGIKRVDEIGLRGSAASSGVFRISSTSNPRVSEGMEYDREMSQGSCRSDDDLSYYLDEQHSSASRERAEPDENSPPRAKKL